MVELRLLGGAVLLRDGALLRSRIGQPYHLALLAVVAASPHRCVSRDRLIGLLWPERDARRARHRLSVGLHVARKELGAGVILTSGDTVALAPGAIEIDVALFEEHVAQGRLEAAVQLVRGPFLDGFFLRGGQVFDEWVEAERVRLGALYRSTLEHLIVEERSRGGPGATAWARRLFAHEPYDSRVALEVMRTLSEHGEPSEALRVGRAHVARTSGELELPPDPAVVRAIEDVTRAQAADRLGFQPTEIPVAPVPDLASVGGTRKSRTWPRRRRGGGGGPVPVAIVAGAAMVAAGALLFGPSPPERRSSAPVGPMAVGSFRATVDSGPAAALARALPGRLSVHLSPLTGRRLKTTVSGDERLGAEGRLDGEIDADSERLELVARLTLPEPAGSVEFGRWTRPSASPIDAADDLAFVLAEAVLGHLDPASPKAYTRSRWAYGRFLEGVVAHRRFTRDDIWMALQFYREAVEEDPDFALAHAVTGNAYIDLTMLGLPERVGLFRARPHVDRALVLDSALAEGHAALGFLQLWADGEWAAGGRSLQRAILLDPSIPQARNWYAWYAVLIRDWLATGVENARLALDLAPLNAAQSHALAQLLFLARRFEEIPRQSEHTWDLDPDVARAAPDSPLADAYREMGRYDEAIREYAAVHERIGGIPPAGLGVTYARLGRREEAEVILRQHEERARESAMASWGAAAIAANLGDADAALGWLVRAGAARPSLMAVLRVDPTFDPLRSDERLDSLLADAGVPPASGSHRQ